MGEHLLSVWSTSTWVIEDFWVSLLVAVGLFGFRVIKPRRYHPRARFLRLPFRKIHFRLSSSASTVPILVWALEVNQLQRVVSSTHASIQSKMLLASMQEVLGAMLLLVALVGLDILGRFVEARQQGLVVAPFPTSAVLVVATIVADWLLSEIGWWALIHEHLVP